MARQPLGGGQPAISPWALVPHVLIQPLVPGWRTVRMSARMRAASARRRGCAEVRDSGPVTK